MPAEDSASEVTRLLERIRGGNDHAKQELFRHIEHELRETARNLMLKERSDHSLQATEVINEAVVRILRGQVLEEAPNRKYLFGAIVRAMRHTLVDHARKRNTRKKQGGVHERVALDEVVESFEEDSGVDLESLELALTQLGRENARQRDVVELRFFGGLSVQRTAEVLGVSQGTVERDWRLARAKLYRELGGTAG